MPTAQDVIEWMDRLVGYKYKFGGELTGSAPGNCDCSEAVEYACRNTGVSPKMPDGSGNQFSHCDNHVGHISFEDARNTPGSLIYKAYDNSASNYPPGDRNSSGGIYHVAVVKSYNTTTEVCCDDGQTIVNKSIDGRAWYAYGTRIPGVDYGSTPPPQPVEPPAPDVPVNLPVEGGGNVALRELRKGHEGRDVRQMQALLSEWAISPGAHDGQFGGGTDSAVRSFQSARGLGVDGIVGERTWSSLLGR